MQNHALKFLLTMLFLFSNHAFSQITAVGYLNSLKNNPYEEGFIRSALHSFSFSEKRLNDLKACDDNILIVEKSFFNQHIAKIFLTPLGVYSIFNLKLPNIDGSYQRNKVLGYTLGGLAIGMGTTLDYMNHKSYEKELRTISSIRDFLHENLDELTQTMEIERIDSLLTWQFEKMIAPEDFTSYLFALSCEHELKNDLKSKAKAYKKHLKTVHR